MALVRTERHEGTLLLSKDQVQTQGWGCVQAPNLGGELPFHPGRSPLLQAYTRGDAVTFEVVNGPDGLEAVNLALPGQPQPAAVGPQPTASTTEPRDLCGMRVQGVLDTARNIVLQQQWGQVSSHEFVGEVAFNLADSPGFSYMVFDKGDPVSFELVLHPEFNVVQARHVRVAQPGSQPQPGSQAGLAVATAKASSPTTLATWASWGGDRSASWGRSNSWGRSASWGRSPSWGAQLGAQMKRRRTSVLRPELLPTALFSSQESAESKMDIVCAVLEEQVRLHGSKEDGWGPHSALQTLVREADALFSEDDLVRAQLADRLSAHPWLLEKAQAVRFDTQQRYLVVERAQLALADGSADDKAEPQQPKPMDDRVCWFWRENKCSKGASCNFRHHFTAEEERAGLPSITSASDSWDMGVCWYWQNTECIKGAACPFRHHLAPGDERPTDWSSWSSRTTTTKAPPVQLRRAGSAQAERVPQPGGQPGPQIGAFAAATPRSQLDMAMAQLDPSIMAQLSWQTLLGCGAALWQAQQ